MLWHALQPEVPGGWGQDTVADVGVHPPVVTALNFEFSWGWLGDDLVESFPCYIVTDRLAAALSATSLTGFVLDDVLITLDPQFVLLSPDEAAAVPIWRWLRIIGEPWSDDFWTDEKASIRVSDAALAVLRTCTLDHCEITPVT